MSNYEVPSWAGKPPAGTHLDVLKEEKLIQKLMLDQKKCFLFGRNNQINDFCIDHSSASRCHAALVYHKHLSIAYLVDLNSTHGTFIGSVRLEPHKPTILQINSSFHFGASTRNYILRERPSNSRANILEEIPLADSSDGTLLGLPESQDEVDNLTEYNTAHNRRISTLGISNDNTNFKKNNSLKRKRVTFNEDEIIINPEDIDASIGRFRNLVSSTVVPTSKRMKLDLGLMQPPMEIKSHQSLLSPSLYSGLPPTGDLDHGHSSTSADENPFGLKLGLLLPNPAPEIVYNEPTPVKADNRRTAIERDLLHDQLDLEPKKKKYAKEAWPKLMSRKTNFNLSS